MRPYAFVFVTLACSCGGAPNGPATPSSDSSSSTSPPPAPPWEESSHKSSRPSSPDAPHADPGAEAAAQHAAEAWLASIDQGKYADSWTAASTLFRAAIDQPGWSKTMGSGRAPLGAVSSRALVSSTYATHVPGAPDGEYVILRYATSFANKAQSTETVTPMKDTDGQWHVSGYFIK
jgi:hypothetical protein